MLIDKLNFRDSNKPRLEQREAESLEFRKADNYFRVDLISILFRKHRNSLKLAFPWTIIQFRHFSKPTGRLISEKELALSRMISLTFGDFPACFGSLKKESCGKSEQFQRNCLTMSIVDYGSKSVFLVFDFSAPQVRIFNRKKRQLAYLLLSFNIYELIMAIFNTWNNNSLYRFCEFIAFSFS